MDEYFSQTCLTRPKRQTYQTHVQSARTTIFVFFGSSW